MSYQDEFQQAIVLCQKQPQAGEALIIYALVNTLAFEKSGCLFKLNKLKDLSAETRQLAYRLMDIMASDQDSARFFADLKQKLDEVVRAG